MRKHDARVAGFALALAATAPGCEQKSPSSAAPVASVATRSAAATAKSTAATATATQPSTGRWCATPADSQRIAVRNAPKVGNCPKLVDGALRPATGGGALDVFPATATADHELAASAQATEAAGEPRCCYDWRIEVDARP